MKKRNQNRRLLALTLALAMCVGMTCTTAFAAEEEPASVQSLDADISIPENDPAPAPENDPAPAPEDTSAQSPASDLESVPDQTLAVTLDNDDDLNSINQNGDNGENGTEPAEPAEFGDGQDGGNGQGNGNDGQNGDNGDDDQNDKTEPTKPDTANETITVNAYVPDTKFAADGWEKQNSGWYATGTMDLDIPENVIADLKANPGEEYAVSIKQSDGNGTEVIYTTLKWNADDGFWHLDGAVTAAKQGVEVYVKADELAIEKTGLAANQYGYLSLSSSDINAILPVVVNEGDAMPELTDDIKAQLNALAADNRLAFEDGSIEWKYIYDPSGKVWHLDGELTVSKQNVSVIISDVTGQLNAASNGSLNVANWDTSGSFWHDVYTEMDQILPKPENYEGKPLEITPKRQVELTEALMTQKGISELDGSIKWEYVLVDGVDGTKHWDIQGSYVPNNLHVYVYLAGDNGLDGNGRDLNTEEAKKKLEAEGWEFGQWQNAGQLKIPLTDELKALFDELNGMNKAYKDLTTVDKDLNSRIQAELSKLEFFQNNNVDWFGLKVDDGADGGPNSKYLTIHLDGYVIEVPVEPDVPIIITPPTNDDNDDDDDDDDDYTPPTANVPDENVPLEEEPQTDLPEEDVPLAELPEVIEPEAEIEDEDIPLADVPQTGDSSAFMWYAMTLLSACALAILNLRKKHF